MIAILDHRQNHVVSRQPVRQRKRMSPRNVRILRALQDPHRTSDLDRTTKQQMLAAFLDSAMGTAVFHTLQRRAVTLRLSLDYLGPGRIGDWLQAEGEGVGHDEHVAQVRGRLYGPRHEVLTGLGAFALLSRHRTLKARR